MSYRFIKRIPIIPKLIYLNITKHGLSSITIGIGWFSFNIGKNGIRKTMGVHGSGLSFRKDIKYKNKKDSSIVDNNNE
jgi:hypothetical protein